ncbi:MAG: hypothetical protein IT265_10950 [Saprospiraceae bacterium]|nr:hypothetical protein [Saprospiraceae bacterium]
MKYLLRISFFIKFLACIYVSNAQPQRILFDSYRVKDGLSNDQVFAIIKDNSGYLWIGTRYGLNRFDGKSFKKYYNDGNDSTSLRDNLVYKLLVDHKNQLWIGTRTGLAILDLSTDKFRNIDFSDLNSRTIRNNEIFDLWQNPKTKVIYIASNKGVFYSDGNTKYLNAFPDHTNNKLLNNLSIRSICFDSKERLWFGTSQGLILYNIQDSTYINMFTPLSSEAAFTDNNVRDVYEDRRGDIWVATWGSGIRKFNMGDSTFEDYIQDTTQYKVPIANINLQIGESNRPGEEDLLWLACDNPGFSCFNVKTKKFKPYFTLSEDSRFLILGHSKCLYSEEQDGLWIGGQYGLWKYDPRKQIFDVVNFFNFSNDKGLNQITSLYCDELDTSRGTLFVGTWNNGAYQYDFKTKKIENLEKKYRLPLLKESYFKQIGRDREKYLLLATDRSGLIQCSTNSNFPSINVFLKDQFIICFYVDVQNNYWIGTANGLFFISKDRKSIRQIELIPCEYEEILSYEVKSICADRSGSIWISLGNDAELKACLVKLNPNTFKTTLFYQDDHKSDFPIYDEIRNLVCDSKNQMYCASRKGMVSWNANDSIPLFKLYTIKDGLCNDFIYEIAVDKLDQIWISTLQGLSCYLKDVHTFRNYFTNNGLIDNEVRGLQYSNGLLFICYWALINYCDPTQIELNSNYPKQKFSEFLVNNKPFYLNGKLVASEDRIVLNYDENSLEIGMSALSYTNPELTLISYFMEGFDKKWNEGLIQKVNYNLKDGTYIFHFRSRNSDGIWNPNSSKLYIQILAPFWKTWWFISLLCLTIFSVIIIYFRIKEKQRKRVEGIRFSIARDLHDDMGSNLSNIKLISEMAALKNDGKNLQTYKSITEKTSQIMEHMSDIVWSINPKNDGIELIIPYIQEHVINVLEPLEINLKFEILNMTSKIEMDIDKRRHFFLICKEATNNISKYAKAKHVIFKIEFRNNKIFVEIIDDGIGFHSSSQKSGNGLINMSKRAELIGGSLDVTSEPKGGTTIRFWFPVT